MSGPKVVDIRAIRRQMQRESAARLRELSAAIEECLNLQESGHPQAAELRERAGGLLSRLEEMRAGEKYGDLLNEAERYRDFYAGEAQQLKRRFVERRTTERRQEHRRRQLAGQLRAELEQMPPSPKVAKVLRTLESAGSSDDGLSQLLNEVTALKQDDSAAAEADKLRALALGYLEPEPAFPVGKPDCDEARLEHCWEQLGELEALGGKASLEIWREEIEAATAAAAEERTLLLDSLSLRLIEHFRAARERKALAATAEELLTELASISEVDAEARRSALASVLEGVEPMADSTRSIEEAKVWLSAHRAAEDTRAQRAAVLHALATLGYEVREGMATAWVEQGRVVVHKPDETTYGIEFAAPPTGSVFQTRVVTTAPEANNPLRDKEVEEGWCSEFAKLRDLLAREGYETKLTQARAPGSVPVKVVAAKHSAKAQRVAKSELSRRTMP